jgi:hypothetical protein
VKIWWAKRNVNSNPPADNLEYFWKGQRGTCPTAYIAIARIREDAGPREVAKALSRCRRTRGVVFKHLVLPTPSRTIKARTKKIALIWDEILPLDGGSRPTHFLEIGVWNNPNLPRSPFFKTALCLRDSNRDASYCAGEIGGFLQWGILRWEQSDFSGAAIDPESPGQLWLLQCLFAEWKRLRRDDAQN